MQPGVSSAAAAVEEEEEMVVARVELAAGLCLSDTARIDYTLCSAIHQLVGKGAATGHEVW